MAENIEYQTVAGPVIESGFVGYVRSAQVPDDPSDLLPRTRCRLLSADREQGRAAMRLDLPAGYQRAAGPIATGSIDLVVLAGSLAFGTELLGPRDFAFVPSGCVAPEIGSAGGATVLLFVDPPPPAERIAAQQALGAFVTRYHEDAWSEPSLVRNAGLELDLAIQMLKADPATTARTWYVRQGAGGKVPWERHSVVEEGFLMSGDYRLAERLPARAVIGDYEPGGYFRRPPGVLHSGPESGTATGAIWLQRSPAALDVEFFSD
ncbi:MAG TPA: hypothetical protein VLT59_01180 [Steroidobacteraceae bacterium]|nr:hypothetical protein [Steroidobacteraceae bacterium]